MQPTYSDTRIAKNRSGFYEIRWTERDENGRARTRSNSLGTKDRGEAEAARLAWLAAGQTVAQSSVEHSVADLIDAYEKGHLDANGISAAQRWALKAIRELLGNDTLLSLNLRRVQWYRQQRANRGRADGTVRRELGALVAVLNWCHKNEVLPRDTILPNISLPPEGQARQTYLIRSEEERMFRLASGLVLNDTPRWRAGLFICLALETAARARAIETLEWSRVDMVAGVIDFRDPSERRTRKRRVPVPISKRLEPVLKHAHKKAANAYVLGTTVSTRKVFDTFCKEHGFDVTRHDLRRTWASLAAQDGVDMAAIAAVLGDTLETTIKHYAYLSPGYLRAAVDRTRAA